jgi:hypothetical protein
MIVARQFIAWNTTQKRIRPVGTVRGIVTPEVPCCDEVCKKPKNMLHKRRSPQYQANDSYRTLRDGAPSGALFQAINCLATIIPSLRDKVRQVPPGGQVSRF